MTTDGVDAECGKCGYEWTYTGELVFATCPSCRANVKIDPDPND